MNTSVPSPNPFVKVRSVASTLRRTIFQLWSRLLSGSSGMWFAMALLCLGAVVFVLRFLPFVSDSVLAWIKVVSIAITGLLGIIGVITDFKDENTKEITTAGKFNLAGLILAGVIGVIAQRAESIKAAKSAEKASEEYKKLIGENEQTLHQVQRLMEPLGDTIGVQFSIWVKMNDGAYQYTLHSMLRALPKLVGAKGLYEDSKTKTRIAIDGRNNYDLTFGEASRKQLPLAVWVLVDETPSLGVYSTFPSYGQNCSIASDADGFFMFKSAEPNGNVAEVMWNTGGPEFILRTMSYLTYQRFKRKPELWSQMDFDGKYILFRFNLHQYEALANIEIKVGERTIEGKVFKSKPNKCGDYIFQVPPSHSK